MDKDRESKKLDYVKPGMTREETLEAMLKACLEAIDDADKVVALQSARGYPYTGKWIDSKVMKEYING